MLCETARKHLDTLSDGERLASTRQYASVQRHCLTCAACRTYRRQLRHITRTARHLPVALPNDLRERVLSQLPANDAQPNYTYAGTYAPRTRQREIAMFKRLTAITGAALLAAIAATITAKWTPPQPVRQQITIHTNELRDWHTAYDYPVTSTLLSQIGRRSNAASLAKAKLLRDQWHRWAMQHREELRQMLQASGTDRATLTRVYNLLLPTLVLRPGDCMARFMEHQNGYSWQIVLGFTSVTQMRDEAILHDFTEYRDIKLLVFDPNDKNDLHVEYVLWASGRVTQNTYSGYNSLYRDGFIRDIYTPQNSSVSLNTSGNPGSTLHADSIMKTYNVLPPYEELTR